MHAHQDALRVFLERGLDFSNIGPAFFLGWATVEHGITACVAYHNWNPDSRVIELSAFSTRRDWLSKDRLREIFGYPFGQLGARICIARTSVNNTRARRIWRAMGAQETIVPELWDDGEAASLLIIKRGDWLAGKFMRD